MKNIASLVHQLKWDLRSAWWALLAVVVLAPFVVSLEMREFAGLEDRRTFVESWSSCVWVLMMMIAVVALVLLIQKDAPAGSREFWLSRPVSRRAMLGSKLVVFGLFVSILGVTSLVAPMMTGAKDDWWAFLVSFVVKSAWILGLALVLASVSQGVSQVLRNGLLMGGVVFVLSFLRISLSEVGFLSRFYEVEKSAVMIAWMVLFAGSLGLVIRQYLRRSMKGGLLALTALLVICWSVYLAWPVNLLGDTMSSRTQQEEGWDEVSLKLELRDEDIERFSKSGAYGNVNGVDVKSLMSSGLLGNVPEGFSVQRLRFSGGFEVDGEPAWVASDSLTSAATFLPKGELEEFVDLKNGTERETPKSYEGERALRLEYLRYAQVPIEVVKGWKGKKISYRGNARVEAVKMIRFARFRYGVNAEKQVRGERMEVRFEGVGVESHSFEIRSRSWYPNPIETSLNPNGMKVVLVNEKRNEFFELDDSGFAGGRAWRFAYWRKDFSPKLYSLNREMDGQLDQEEWLAECFVYLYMPVSQGEFVVPVKLLDFGLEDVMSPLD